MAISPKPRISVRMSALESTRSDLESWRSAVESSIDDIKMELRKLNKLWDRSNFESSALDLGLLARPESMLACLPAKLHTNDPIGHREEFNHWDQVFGSVTTYLPDLVKGKLPYSPSQAPLPRYHGTLFDTCSTRARLGDYVGQSTGKILKLPFPLFDGHHPRLWISRFETYFDMYQVDPESLVKNYSMHLSPMVSCWF